MNGLEGASTATPRAGEDARLVRALEECVAALEAGARPDRKALEARYPDLAGALAECLDALEFVEQAAPELRGGAGGEGLPATPPGAPAVLGDYRLVAEVGRGGMGVVYEAEQVSLGRRVALKVLPLAAALDPRHLQRFRSEAQAAAQLHHPHIVPVYAVGVERGVHYYAMQFIDGQPLSVLIRERRRDAGLGASEAPTGPSATLDSRPSAAAPAAATPLPAQRDTLPSGAGGGYFRLVAELGRQAAEALEHAHARGVVHRDVKPANLLLDREGKLWVADFGLARLPDAGGPTLTGDLVGTLRYMSPEQVRARHGLVDHRTDVYSLGATLYELLTFEPVFDGQDRGQLLAQIAQADPRPPRAVRKAVPADLETIVLKALAKNPDERYPSARELADDLRRFLEEKPIRAKPPTPLQRLRKWARRHRPLVWSVTAGTLIAAVVSAVSLGWALGDRAARRAAAREVVRLSLSESLALHRRGNTPAALTEARRAGGLLAGLDADDPLRRSVAEALTDLGLVARLERARLGEPVDRGEAGAARAIEADYALAFRDYGIDVAALPAEEAGARLRGRDVSAAVAAALDDWAAVCRRPPRPDEAKARHLLAVARAADLDEWRDRCRAALAERDCRALKDLAADRRAGELPPATLVLLATTLRRVGAAEEAVAVLRRAYARHPGDFWVNFQLAVSLMKRTPPRAHEAARHYTAALVSRPESAAVYLNLGVALQDAGAIDEALAALERATALEPTFAPAYNNLGNVLARKGRREEAEAAFREALRLRPDLHEAHYNLGSTLWDLGRQDEALRAFQAALAVKPDFAPAYAALAYRYRRLGRPDEAIAAYRDFLRLEPGSAAARTNLGGILLERGRLAEAADLAREALGKQHDLAEASNLLGSALRAQGLLDEAITAYQGAARSRPRYAAAHCNLGVALGEAGRRDEALRAFREALRLQPDLAEAHCGLGLVLLDQGQFDEALASLRRGHTLGRQRPGWPHPSGEWVADCERVVRLRLTVSDALRGEARVTSGVDLLALARLCSALNEDLAAARYFRDAFRADPALAANPRTSARCDAARAAARAGLRGEGDAGWRRQALDWLRADLTFWEKHHAQNTERARGEARLQLSRWQREPDFAGVRGPAALGRLPEEERSAWGTFWGAVARLTAAPPRIRTHERMASPGP